MAKSYSSDLRSRVVAYVESGHSRRSAARRFGVSDSFTVKLLQRVVEHGSLSPGRQGRPRGSRLACLKASSSARWKSSPTSPCRNWRCNCLRNWG